MREFTETCEELRSRANDLEHTAAASAPADASEKERAKAVEAQLKEAERLRRRAAERHCL